MSKFSRAVRGAQAGAFAAAGVALSFFVLDLIRLEPLATPGFLSGAVIAPAGLQWDLTNWAGFFDGLMIAYRITTFTLMHFLIFALIGVVASVYFDWRQGVRFKSLLAVAALCIAAFTATVIGSGSVVALGSVGPVTIVLMNVFAAILLAGYLGVAYAPGPEDEGSA